MRYAPCPFSPTILVLIKKDGSPGDDRILAFGRAHGNSGGELLRSYTVQHSAMNFSIALSGFHMFRRIHSQKPLHRIPKH